MSGLLLKFDLRRLFRLSLRQSHAIWSLAAKRPLTRLRERRLHTMTPMTPKTVPPVKARRTGGSKLKITVEFDNELRTKVDTATANAFAKSVNYYGSVIFKDDAKRRALLSFDANTKSENQDTREDRAAGISVFLDPTVANDPKSDFPLASKKSPGFQSIITNDAVKDQTIASMLVSLTALQTDVAELRADVDGLRMSTLPPTFALARNMCSLMYWGIFDMILAMENGWGMYGPDPSAWTKVLAMTPQQLFFEYHKYRTAKRKLYPAGKGFPPRAAAHAAANSPQRLYNWLSQAEFANIDAYFHDATIGIHYTRNERNEFSHEMTVSWAAHSINGQRKLERQLNIPRQANDHLEIVFKALTQDLPSNVHLHPEWDTMKLVNSYPESFDGTDDLESDLESD